MWLLILQIECLQNFPPMDSRSVSELSWLKIQQNQNNLPLTTLILQMELQNWKEHKRYWSRWLLAFLVHMQCQSGWRFIGYIKYWLWLRTRQKDKKARFLGKGDVFPYIKYCSWKKQSEKGEVLRFFSENLIKAFKTSVILGDLNKAQRMSWRQFWNIVYVIPFYVRVCQTALNCEWNACEILF